jgi:hypothetical protein
MSLEGAERRSKKVPVMAGLVPAIRAPAIERDGDPIDLARMAVGRWELAMTWG